MKDIKELALRVAKEMPTWGAGSVIPENYITDFATRLIAAYTDGQEPVAWIYCPECGSEEIHYEEGRHKQCANCHQEWFSDIDYSDVVQSNLSKLFTAPPEPAPQQEPVAWRTHHDEPMLFPTINEAWQYCEDDEGPEPLFAAPVKNAKLDRKWIEASQRIATLEQRVAELENVISEHGADMWAQGEEYAVLSAKCAQAQIKADAFEQQVAALEKAAAHVRPTCTDLYDELETALSKVKQP